MVEKAEGDQRFFFANTKNRSWKDMREFGFWQGGRTEKIVGNVKKVAEGDIICAYLSGHGYLGIGKVTQLGVPGSQWLKTFSDKESLSSETIGSIEDGALPSSEAEDFVVIVEWEPKSARQLADAFKTSGLFASPMTLCRLRHEPTIEKLIDRYQS